MHNHIFFFMVFEENSTFNVTFLPRFVHASRTSECPSKYDLPSETCSSTRVLLAGGGGARPFLVASEMCLFCLSSPHE